MFIALAKDRYSSIRPLFANFDYHLIIEAVILGNSPALVFVDNIDNPKTVFMKSPEGEFLAGAPDNAVFNQGMRDWVEQNLLNGEEDELVFESYSEDWVTTIKEIMEKRPPVSWQRYYYEISEVKLSPPPLSPEFSLQLVTPEFIAQDNIENMEAITGGIESNWSSQELFFEKGFGLCILHENEVVSWSVVDMVAGNRCEIGIHTKEEFQRRGLATALIAAVVEHAISQGFKRIGWHCWFDNLGSIGVAEKVGLVRKHSYVACISLQNESIHYAFTGYKRLQVQDYLNAKPAYLKSIETVDDESRYFLPRIYWEMARVEAGLGNTEATFDAMHSALKHEVRYTKKSLEAIEFAQFKENPDWHALFAKEKDSLA